jgi:hypothetical protein
MRYAVVIGSSWSGVSGWLQRSLGSAFVGIRFEAGEAYIVCDIRRLSHPPTPELVHELERLFEIVDSEAWTLDGVFIARSRRIATAHRLASRVAGLLEPR